MRKCWKCKGEVGGLTEETKKEFLQRYGVPLDTTKTEILCDDCDKEFMDWMKSLTPAERRKLDQEAFKAGEPIARF